MGEPERAVEGLGKGPTAGEAIATALRVGMERAERLRMRARPQGVPESFPVTAGDSGVAGRRSAAQG